MQDIRVEGTKAYALPGVPGSDVPSPPNSVDDLRFVFIHYLGTSRPMLPSRTYCESDLPADPARTVTGQSRAVPPDSSVSRDDG